MQMKYQKKGWRQKLEDAWNDKVTRARYNYNWKLDEKGNPIVNFYTDKIHKRCGYKWTHPVHEVLKYNKDYENIITIDGIVLNHYPDVFKSRGSYLSLLELSVEEDPEDDRNMHYLGREYMYYGKWNEASAKLATAEKIFSNLLNTVTNDYTNQATMSQCYISINELKKAVGLQDKEIFFIEYRNLMSKMEIIVS